MKQLSISQIFVNGICSLDLYGPPLKFKVQGKERATNLWGALISMAALIGSLYLASDTFMDYVNGTNPTVVENKIYGLEKTIFSSRNLSLAMSFYSQLPNPSGKGISAENNNQTDIYRLRNINIGCPTCTAMTSSSSRLLQSQPSATKKMALCNPVIYNNVTIKGMNDITSNGVISIFSNYSYCLPDSIAGTIEYLNKGDQDTSFQISIPYLKTPVDFTTVAMNTLGAPKSFAEAINNPVTAQVIAADAKDDEDKNDSINGSNGSPASPIGLDPNQPSNGQPRNGDGGPGDEPEGSGGNPEGPGGSGGDPEGPGGSGAGPEGPGGSGAGPEGGDSDKPGASGAGPGDDQDNKPGGSLDDKDEPGNDPNNFEGPNKDDDINPNGPGRRILQTNPQDFNLSDNQIKQTFSSFSSLYNMYKYPKLLLLSKDLDLNPSMSEVAKEVYILNMLDYKDILQDTPQVFNVYLEQVTVNIKRANFLTYIETPVPILRINRIEVNKVDSLGSNGAYLSFRHMPEGKYINVSFVTFTDFLADFGGIYSTLNLVAGIFASIIGNLHLDSMLINGVFKFVDHKPDGDNFKPKQLNQEISEKVIFNFNLKPSKDVELKDILVDVEQEKLVGGNSFVSTIRDIHMKQQELKKSVKKYKVNIADVFCMGFKFCRKKRNKLFVIEKSSEIIDKKLQVENLVKKLLEFEMLKKLLLGSRKSMIFDQNLKKLNIGNVKKTMGYLKQFGKVKKLKLKKFEAIDDKQDNIDIEKYLIEGYSDNWNL
jgi:hypothetical protein